MMIKTERGLSKRLLAAVTGSLSDDIPALLRQGADINASLNAREDRALHIASKNGDLGTVQTLIRHAADITSQNLEGSTPLMVALENARTGVAIFLLESSYGLPIEEVSGNLALHYAAERSLLEPVKKLLKMRADANTTDADGQTPLHYALQPRADEPNLEVLRLLLNAGAKPTMPSAGGTTPLHLAAGMQGQEEALFLLIKKADTLEVGEPFTPLVQAASLGQIGSMWCLLDAGARINSGEDGTSALFAAFEGKHIDAFSMLLERGAAKYRGSLSDSRKRSLLHLAAMDSSRFGYEALRTLLKQYENKVNIRDEDGETPLFKAVTVECIPNITLLLDHGADPTTRNKTKISARSKAAMKGNLRILQLLYGKMASSRTTDKMYFPFADAITSQQFECAAYLLGLGFDINESTRCGIPVLHNVAARGNLPGVKWLLRQGADKSLQATSTGEDAMFQTPGPIGTVEDVARSFGHTEVADYLASYQE